MGELAAGGMAIDPECLDLGSRPLANFPEQRINRREGPLVTRTKVAIGVPETAIIIGPALREILLVESGRDQDERSEEHTSELQSLMRISYAVFCLKKKKRNSQYKHTKR